MRNNKKYRLTPYGMKVKKALLERGWTQKEFCEREKFEQSRFSELLYGKRPCKKYLDRIEKVLGVKESA